jgi:REG-2-like HAD superfamily hydrolase
MKPKVVTFDCANTLVRVKWSPGGFAVDCARAVGLDLGDEERSIYEQTLRSRWVDYQEINKLRDPAAGDAFWRKLTEDWLLAIAQPLGLAEEMMAAAPDLLYGKASEMFVLFDDILPTLEVLEELGIRTGVISNWDYSLHRVLRALEIHDKFDFVIASLEEGVEKPDPLLFNLTLQKFGVRPGEALHVGDDPVDDFRGAQDVGMRSYLIDRTHPASSGAMLARMTDLIDLL